ncbi:MAG TPA: hypothetical protein PL048_10060 [Leptospiraceae bacterium]|nr:hypothetical protein [Leptospiraceae bacterium]HNF15255.1 hypothetical protein [Leptospiraceae bacterium]HNF25406.1 hypothetical protein [Leptospiraceae bacterium]HNI97740.1 hypothetical protein [Leptospiraceae bacterium]HNN05668.1 hypothetical protein [Leptospiraceae bacterium]
MKKITIQIVSIFLSFGHSLYAGESFRLIFSHSLKGNVNACTCTAIPIAGLLKRDFFFQKIQVSPDRDILIEAGDFYAPSQDAKKKPALEEGFSRMGYHLLVPGMNEFKNAGSDELNRFSHLTVSNIKITGSSSQFTSGIGILERNGRKVVILPYMTKAAFLRIPEPYRKKYSHIPFDAVYRYVQENVKHDFLILAVYGKLADAPEWISVKKEKSVVILGGDETKSSSGFSDTASGRIYHNSGKNGDDISVLEISLKDFKVIQSKVTTLDADKEKDSERIQKILDKYGIKD